MTGMIEVRKADGVCTLTLNRPEKLNAFTWEMLDEFQAALSDAEGDARIHAIVIRAAGRAFCSGFDLSSVVDAASAATPHEDVLGMQRAASHWRRLWLIRKPVIVAVHGYCLGAGMEMVVHADFSIAADDAVFGYPAVRGSGMPDTHMFVYHVGPQWAKRILLTGDSIDAKTANDIGLVMETVPREELDGAVAALAASIGQVPLPLLESGKHVVNQATELMGYTALQRENWSENALARATPEVAEFSRIAIEEGVKAAIAWRDKRK